MATEHAIRLSRQDLETGGPILNTILDNLADAAAVIGAEQEIVYLTPGFAELTGQTLEEYAHHPMDELKIDGQARIREVFHTGLRQTAVPMQVGAQKLLVNLVPILSTEADGQILGVMLLIVFRSMAVLKRSIQTLERSSQPSEPAAPAQTASRGACRYTFSDFIGEADNVIRTIEQCQRISHTDHPVLLIGETGVGKEIIADGIYMEYSGGQPIPFVKINCSAIPRDLLESELFGHEKGAFTGATSLKKGKFELAAGGILLLDEIGEMDYSLQSKLLRVLEAREFERIGGSRVIPMRARIIASTNQNLKQMVADGKFRMDLYYRLNIFEITIPPLRAHKSDIPLLIRHFTQADGLQLEFTEDAKGMLLHYDWPGNVRELRNVLNRLSFLYPGTVIGVQQVYNATGEMLHLVTLPAYRNETDPLPMPTMPKYGETALPAEAAAPLSASSEPAGGTQDPGPETEPPAGTPAPEEILTMEEYEKQILQKAIQAAGGSIPQAAVLLGISRATAYSKVKKYGL